MGIIILPIFLITISLLIGMLTKTTSHINKTKNYKPLFWGFLLSVVEMIIIITTWNIEGEIYIFHIILTPFYWIICLSITTLILSFIPNNISKKISNIFSANVLTYILLTFILIFTSETLFKLLNIKTHY